jgi:hypothetical protein
MKRLLRSLQHCFLPSLGLGDGSLPRSLRSLWPMLLAGQRYCFQSQDAVHEVCAVLTAQGWLLDDVQLQGGRHLYHVQKPAHGSINAVEPDWLAERVYWRPAPPERTWPTAVVTPGGSAADRRCHVIGVGIAKSGTSSLAGLFSRYRSAHEYDTEETLRRVSHAPTTLDVSWLQQRDARAGFLECDSSQLHLWYLAELWRAFPGARFVLTLREPRAWLASLIDHRLARGIMPIWAPLETLRFGPPAQDGSVLAMYGRPTLDAMLAFWARHHQIVLETIPPERLLLLPLADLDTPAGLARISEFAGVSEHSLTPTVARQNMARARFHLLERLPAEQVEAAVERHCSALWQRMNHMRE